MKKKRVPVLFLAVMLILGMLTPQTTLAADDGAAEPEILERIAPSMAAGFRTIYGICGRPAANQRQRKNG